MIKNTASGVINGVLILFLSIFQGKLYLTLLLLGLCASVFGQEEDGSGDEDGAEPAEGEELCKECEEAWEYVEFLKREVNEKITEILQDFKSSGGAEEAVVQTMEQVNMMIMRFKSVHRMLRVLLLLLLLLCHGFPHPTPTTMFVAFCNLYFSPN